MKWREFFLCVWQMAILLCWNIIIFLLYTLCKEAIFIVLILWIVGELLWLEAGKKMNANCICSYYCLAHIFYFISCPTFVTLYFSNYIEIHVIEKSTIKLKVHKFDAMNSNNFGNQIIQIFCGNEENWKSSPIFLFRITF